MRGVSLASGSAGNAYLVESCGKLLLIDCGISCRELLARMGKTGFSPCDIAGVLFTHEHTDHCKGVATFHKRFPEIGLFANAMTAEAIGLEGDAYIFENTQPFEVGPFAVTAFSIPHDVSDPVGFVVEAEGKTYFHATDVGSPLDSIGSRLACADVATLESNHDYSLLMHSNRPELLKKRISGPRGHLSNDDCAALVSRFASPKLKLLSLAHLSSECNEPKLALRMAREALDDAGLAETGLRVLSQNAPGEVWEC